jgi:hypothetical protein
MGGWRARYRRRASVDEGGGEVCLEEEVERLRRSGMSVAEISQDLGVDQGWVEALISSWGERDPAEERA